MLLEVVPFLRSAGDRQPGRGFERPDASPRESLEEIGQPGLEAGPDIEEQIAFRTSRTMSPGRGCQVWTPRSGRKQEARLPPLPGYGRGELPEREDARHDADSGPAQAPLPRKPGPRRPQEGDGRGLSSQDLIRLYPRARLESTGFLCHHAALGNRSKRRCHMAHLSIELKPRLLWKHFAKILTIPHCSGNEKALGDYVLSVAGLAWASRQARQGRQRPRQQARDGRPRRRRRAPSSRGTWTWSARRTRTWSTTSARTRSRPRSRANGSRPRARRSGPITASAWPPALAVMEDKSLVHGPLEFLFTVDEETGLTGRQQDPEGLPQRQDAPQPRQRGRRDLHHRLRRRGGFDARPAPRRGRRRPRRTSTGCTSTGSAAGIPGSTSTRAAATPSSSWPGCSARPRRRPSSSSSVSKAATSGTPSRARPGRPPGLPAASRCGPMTTAFKKAFEKIKVEYKTVETGAA